MNPAPIPLPSRFVARLYWHDKSTGLVSTVPSESQLTPKNWGPIKFLR